MSVTLKKYPADTWIPCEGCGMPILSRGYAFLCPSCIRKRISVTWDSEKTLKDISAPD